MARWSEDKQAEAREAVLNAAKAEFERVGYEAATMRHIAAAAGVAVGTLFNYFPDKLALLRAALHQDLEEVIASSGSEPTESLEELFITTARPFFTYYCKRPDLSRLLLGRTVFGAANGDDIFREQVERVAGKLKGKVTAMQRAGIVDARASADAIVLAFFSHYYFVLIAELGRHEKPEPMLARMRVLARQLHAGVGPEKEKL